MRKSFVFLVCFAVMLSAPLTVLAASLPTITKVSPTSGTANGGTVVTVTGTNFTGATKAVFGTTAGTTLTVVSATQLKIISPAHAVGVVDIRVTTVGGTSTAATADHFTYTAPPAPTVTALTPTSGTATGGSVVTVTGTNFTGATKAAFGGTAGTALTVVSATQIKITSPAHAVGVVDVQVTTSGGTSAAAIADRFTYTTPPAPTVTAVSPTSGTATGGSVVTVTGTNFTGATNASFGGTAGMALTVVSATQIKMTSPAHAVGVVDVQVTTAGGTSIAATADHFTYTTPPAPTVTAVTPTSGTATGGTVVMLTGTNFTGATKAAFGGTAGTALSVVSATQIKITSPAHAVGVVDVQVTTGGGTSAAAIADRFTYTTPPAPTVTALTPTSGTATGGSVVTVTGTNFTGATKASFGGTAGTALTVVSGTQLTITSPAHAVGVVDVQVTTAGGTSIAATADHFTYTTPPAPTVTAVTPTSGTATGGTVVMLTGTNFTGMTKAAFGGTAGTALSVVSATQIKITSPAHAVGAVDVQVTTGGGTSVAAIADRFTYTTPPAPTVTAVSPTSGTATGGTVVTVTGANFTGATKAAFGGTAGTALTVVSATQLKITSPAHAVGAVDVQVTTGGGTSVAATADHFTYTDTSAPAPVSAVTSTTTSTTVTLSWANPTTADFTGVMIRRAFGATAPTSPNAGTLVLDTVGSQTSVTDTGLSVSTQYSYAMFSHDGVPNYAAAVSKTVTTSGPDITPPPVPAGVAVQSRDSAAQVSWNASTAADISGYDVLFSTSQSGPWTDAGSIDAPAVSSVISGLTNGVTYWFVVVAYDMTGNRSAQSAAVSGVPEKVGGVSHCGTLAASQTWAAGTTHALTCTVVVPFGVTLTIAAGAIVKGFSGAQLVVNGSLIAQGTTASPIIFTDVRDDSVGGDYNGDGTGSAPAPNGWSGIYASDSVGDGYHPPSVSLSHIALKFAPMSVNSQGDDRDSTNYVARTTSIANSSFSHGSSLSISAVGSIIVTGDTVTNSTAEQAGVSDGIQVSQNGYLAATTVSGNNVTGASNDGVDVGVQSQSTVAPVVQNNAVSSVTADAVSVNSSQLLTTNLAGNTGTTSTRQGLVLSGTLTGDLTLPFGTLPVVIGGGGLSVGSGTKLTIQAGVAVKSYGGGLNVAGGSLIAAGTAAAPVVFTSVLDDTAGGDYTKDGASTPTPAIWSGVSSADSPTNPASVSLDHVSLRYATASLNSGGDDRDSTNYIARTMSVTNSTFLHGSGFSINAVGPVTATANTVTNSSPESQYSSGIAVTQGGYLSSTTVSGNSVTGTSRFGVQVDVQPGSTVSPVVQNNTVSSTISEALEVTSNMLLPANLTGNTGTTSTRQGLLLSGTLAANLTLPFGTLPVVLGCQCSYYQGNLTVGSGVSLTINAGVVIKSYGGSLNVNGGTLTATGTAASPVVFTSVDDDTAGGDYNKNGNVTTPAPNDWSGISSNDSPVHPASVSLDRVSVRYAHLSINNGGDDRDSTNYVARLTSVTNSTFLHGAALTISAVGPVTVTGNTVSSATAEIPYVGTGIDVLQSGYLSATNVSSNSITGTSNYGVSVQILPDSTVSPVVQNNVVAATTNEAVLIASNQLIPANFTGNTGTASTRQGIILVGTLVSNLSLPFGSLAVVLGCNCGYYYNRYSPNLTVGSGVTLTIAAGVVIKSYGAGITVNGGSLTAAGTAAAPVVFTSVKDDSSGGDYNKDGNVTVPAPYDWSGISTGDSTNHPGSISLDHVSVRYSGVSINNAGDDRDPANYLARTTSITNSTFLHGSPLSINAAGPVAVTGNTLTNTPAEAQYLTDGIQVVQNGYQSSTTVSGNTITGTTRYGVYVQLNPQSTVSPVVQNNTASATTNEVIAVASNELVAANLSGNSGSASTRQGMVLAGTLTSNMALPFGSLALVVGCSNCFYPYYGNLIVGAGAALTIGAGVVVKSYGAGLTISGGSLQAAGTSAAPVVFTSIKDDSFGGDYNKDGNVTVPAEGDWIGLSTDSGGAIVMTGAQIHYASTAISNSGGTASFRGKLTSNYNGSQGSCDPVNGAGSFVDARNVDWGTASGPSPYGTGDTVDQCTIVQPWVGETNFRARFWGGPGSAGYAGSAAGSYGFLHMYGGDPVDVATGNLSISLTDISVPEPGPNLVLARSYNGQSDISGVLGPKWTDSWETSLVLPAGSPTSTYDLHWGDGRIDTYTLSGTSFIAAAGNFTTLAKNGTSYQAVTKAGITYTFTATGSLQSVADRNINTLTVSTDAQNRVTQVSDAAARKVNFTYTGSNLTKVTGPDGQSETFSFSVTGDLTGVTDATGAVVRYTYDANHDLLTATDADGNATLTNTYDANQRVIGQIDASNNATTFSYSATAGTDAFGNPTGTTVKTDPRGGATSYTHTTTGLVTSQTDPVGGTTTRSFSSSGLLLKSTDAMGRVTTYTYDPLGNPLTINDALHRTTTLVYNTLNLPTQITDPTGAVATTSYDARGNVVASTDARGNITTNTVTTGGQLASVTDPAGHTTKYGYDAAGNQISTTDPINRVTAHTYDADGRVLTTTDPAGNGTSYAYNARGDLTKVTDALGKATTTVVDAAGRRTSATDPLGHMTRWTYTPTGLVAGVTDPLGATTTSDYDANGNQIATTDATGSTTSYSYDASNRLVGVTDPAGATTSSTRDADGELISVTDANAQSTTKTYDADGRLTTTTDAEGGHTGYAYDADGRQTVLTDADGHKWTTTYDANGNQASTVDPLARTTTYTYDSTNRLINITDPAGAVTTCAYDAAGQRTTAGYAGGTTASYTYDLDGRLTKRIDSAGTFTETYDANGRTLTTTDALGQTLSFTYDAAGRLTNRTQPGSHSTTLGYDADGRIISATNTGGNASWSYDAAGSLTNASLPNSVSVVVGTDVNHRITGLTYTKSSSAVFSQTVGYDPVSHVTSITDPTGDHTYAYTAGGRLTSDTVNGTTTTWKYDKVGNRTSQTGPTNLTYAYDAADELTTAGTNSYTYDARGNLTKITSPAGTTSYTYDGANHVTGFTAPTGTWTNLVDDNATLLKQSGTSANTYLVDPTSGRTLAQNTTQTLVGAQTYGTVGSATSTVALDMLGTGRALIPATGAAVATNYSPWGSLLTTAPSAGVPGFTGGTPLPDGTTGMGARQLDPSSGRWMSSDPAGIRENNQAYGPYSYVQDQPLNRTDPTGLNSILGGIGSFLSAGYHTAAKAASNVSRAVANAYSSTKSWMQSAANSVGNAVDNFIGRNHATGSYATSFLQDVGSFAGDFGSALGGATYQVLFDDGSIDNQYIKYAVKADKALIGVLGGGAEAGGIVAAAGHFSDIMDAGSLFVSAAHTGYACATGDNCLSSATGLTLGAGNLTAGVGAELIGNEGLRVINSVAGILLP